MIRIKRIYEPPEPDDGSRVLVDRLWPRGISKDRASVDEWMKEIAPTTALREWFNHQAELFPDFRKKYKKELKEHQEALLHLRALSKKKTLTLLYAARDKEHNQAIVLAEVLNQMK